MYNLDCQTRGEKKDTKSPQYLAVPQIYLKYDCLTACIERGDS